MKFSEIIHRRKGHGSYDQTKLATILQTTLSPLKQSIMIYDKLHYNTDKIPDPG